MAKLSGLRFIANALLVRPLGCGATGVLLLSDHPLVGLALCAVAVADLCLVWLLRWRSLAYHVDARLCPCGDP